ncbi:imelysin family protein [bacterium SCSIO 12741]|nr:imelysin family protein [bacterium SCSIO 12741]
MNKGFLLFLFAAILLAGCKKDPDPEPTQPDSASYDQQSLLNNWGDEIIVPGYFAYTQATSDQKSFADAFISDPTESSLQAFSDKWKTSQKTWQSVSLFEFGPGSDHVIRANTNIYPCDTTQIEKNIQNGNLDLSGASRLDEKGYAAIDYLLHHATAAEVVQEFKADSKRGDYLKALVAEVDQLAQTVYQEWNSGSGNHVAEFKSATGSNVGSSLGIMINSVNMHLERFLRDGKVGIPNGERSFSGDPLPGHVEAAYKGDVSKEFIRANLKGLENIYLGTKQDGSNGMGLDDALNSLGAKHGDQALDAAIKSQIASCYSAIDAVPGTMKEAVVQDSDKVSELFKEFQKLVILLKADMPSSLGVLITYQDNDGD